MKIIRGPMEMKLNNATMCKVVQQWIDDQFEEDLDVTNVSQDTDGFEIVLMERGDEDMRKRVG